MGRSGWVEEPAPEAEGTEDPPSTFWPIAQDQVDTCEKQFRLGDYTRAILALRWCLAFEMPLPSWLGEEVLDAMLFCFANGGAAGPGRGGGHAKRRTNSAKHRERHRIVARELARSGVKEKAYLRAHEILIGTPHQGAPRQMRESYEKIQAELQAIFPGRGK